MPIGRIACRARRLRSDPKEPECEQRPFRCTHRVHDVRRIVDQAADARLVPWVARLAPLAARQHDVDLLGWMTMVGVLRARRHEAYADPDIMPDLEPLRAGDSRVSVALRERIALRLGVGPDLPGQLRLDGSEGVGQGTDRA